VHYLHAESEELEPTAIDTLAKQLEPVARLFENQVANQRRYRNHEIDNVNGGTQADLLSQSLSDLFASAPDDPSLIVFNGHGKQSKSTADKVTMELWNDTQMNVKELHGLLNQSNAASRFVFTQCYSGGFHRLAYANPEKGLELSSELRCGFTAESAYRLAEGCSASINTDDYRDYTTYFFAALDGYDRDGEILPIDTDTNGDGLTSMREAHFYTLEHAFSTDLSRSTSEDYLNSWQPWYLKWASGKPALPNNEYAKLYRTLAAKHNIPLDENPAKSIRGKMKDYADNADTLNARRSQLRENVQNVQNELIYAAQRQWPSLAGPYTALFQTLVASGEMLQVSQWLTEQPNYQSLVNLQNEEVTVANALLDNERNLTQMQKLFQFRKLSKLQHQLYQYGTQQQIIDYERLISCEDAPLVFSK